MTKVGNGSFFYYFKAVFKKESFNFIRMIINKRNCFSFDILRTTDVLREDVNRKGKIPFQKFARGSLEMSFVGIFENKVTAPF